jgi:hypothetical protein
MRRSFNMGFVQWTFLLLLLWLAYMLITIVVAGGFESHLFFRPRYKAKEGQRPY